MKLIRLFTIACLTTFLLLLAFYYIRGEQVTLRWVSGGSFGECRVNYGIKLMEWKWVVKEGGCKNNL